MEILAIILATFVVAIVLILFVLKQRQIQRSAPWNSLSTPVNLAHSGSRKLDKVSQKTQDRLLKLLNGDRATANRLVENLRKKNPGKSESWCWEKAIFELERDRY